MAITVRCPQCETSYSLVDRAAGKKVRCKQCQAMIEVPTAGSPAHDEAAEVPLPPKSRKKAGTESVEGKVRDSGVPGEEASAAARLKSKRPAGKRRRWLVASLAGLVVIAGLTVGIVWWLNRSGSGGAAEPPVLQPRARFRTGPADAAKGDARIDKLLLSEDGSQAALSHSRPKEPKVEIWDLTAPPKKTGEWDGRLQALTSDA